MNENKLPKTYEVGIVNIPDHLEEGYDNLIFVLEWWGKIRSRFTRVVEKNHS
jgi:hypothetical protein